MGSFPRAWRDSLVQALLLTSLSCSAPVSTSTYKSSSLHVCVSVSKLPGPYKDTSPRVRADSNQCDPIIIHLPRTDFQRRSHSQVPGGREFGGTPCFLLHHVMNFQCLRCLLSFFFLSSCFVSSLSINILRPKSSLTHAGGRNMPESRS